MIENISQQYQRVYYLLCIFTTYIFLFELLSHNKLGEKNTHTHIIDIYMCLLPLLVAFNTKMMLFLWKSWCTSTSISPYLALVLFLHNKEYTMVTNWGKRDTHYRLVCVPTTFSSFRFLILCLPVYIGSC